MSNLVKFGAFLVGAITRLMDENAVQWFLGGSRNLGFETETSDFDVFCFAGTHHARIVSFIKSVGFKVVDTYDYGLDDRHVTLFVHPLGVHLGLFVTWGQFNLVQADHSLIYSWVKENKKMGAALFSAMRKAGINGSKRYLTLKELASADRAE